MEGQKENVVHMGVKLTRGEWREPILIVDLIGWRRPRSFLCNAYLCKCLCCYFQRQTNHKDSDLINGLIS